MNLFPEEKQSKQKVRDELNKPNAKVRIGLVGVGGVASWHHIPGIQIDPRAKLVAICDPALPLLQQRQEEWGTPKAVGDYREITDDPNIDAVIIASPNDSHVPITMACIKHKKHVMLEKPLGVTSQEAIFLWEEAVKAGIVNMTAFTYRFAPALKYLKHLIDQGELGQIRHFRSQRFLDWPETSLSWRQYKATAGGGNVYDMSIHRLDFAQFLLGRIAKVSGHVKQFVPRDKTPQGADCKPSEIDDWTAIIAEFENGATGVWEGSTVMKGRHNKGFGFEWAEVNGSRGSAVYQLVDPNHLLIGRHGGSLERTPVPKNFLVIDGSPRDPEKGEPSNVFRYDQLFEFVSAITEKRPATPDFRDGAMAQLVADGVLLSSASKTWVNIPKLETKSQQSKASTEFGGLYRKNVIVTGGGTGIGRAVALSMALQGATVYIVGRRENVLLEVVQEFRGKGIVTDGSIVPVTCDVSDDTSVEEAFSKILAESPKIDILVNSAGTNIPARKATELSVSDYKKVMAANVDGAFFCMRKVIPSMVANKNGLIINVSSTAGLRGLPLAGSAYCASKAAMSALGSTFSAELWSSGIRVTNILPGEVNTPIIDQRPVVPSPEARAQMLQPEDVADTIITVAKLPPRAHVPQLVIKPTVQQFWL